MELYLDGNCEHQKTGGGSPCSQKSSRKSNDAALCKDDPSQPSAAYAQGCQDAKLLCPFIHRDRKHRNKGRRHKHQDQGH